jgi:hypothetical protein
LLESAHFLFLREHYDIPETIILPNDIQSSSVSNDMEAEKLFHLEKTEDLCCWKLKDKFNGAAASVKLEQM